MGIKGLFKHLFHYLILATTVLALSACGGGSESSGSSEPIIERQEVEETNLVFVDENLAECVQGLIKEQDYNLVEQITKLECSNQNSDSKIQDVEGIENLFNLQTLDLSNNQITDVAPIAKLKNLKQLNLQNNPLEIAAVLTESESLEQIDLSGNTNLLCVEQEILSAKYGESLKDPQSCQPVQQTIEDVFAGTALETCIQQTAQEIKDKYKAETQQDIVTIYPQQLQHLKCTNQDIRSIEGIQSLLNLRELDLSQNNIDIIEPLQDLTKLKRVLLSKNQIEVIRPLTSSANMQELRLDSNPLTDTGLGPIQNFKALQLLHISNTDIRDLTPLQGLTELLELRANNNRIIDLDPLSSLQKLDSLWVEGNQIAKLDTIQDLPNLAHLIISNNWLTDLTPLQNSDKLRWLHLDGTEVYDLTPLRGLTQLKWLQLNNTRVEDIQAIYPLTKLDWLHLKGNSSIPCEQLKQMEEILTPERIERPDIESCDADPLEPRKAISTIQFEDQELRDCVYDAAYEQGVVNTIELTSLSCSIEEYGEITDISGLDGLSGLQTIDLGEHHNIECTQLEQFDEDILLRPDDCNHAPEIYVSEGQSITAGQNATIYVDVTDEDDNISTYNWVQISGDSGDKVELSNPNSSRPTFTAPEQEQVLTFQLTVTDEYGLTATQTITVAVTAEVGNYQLTVSKQGVGQGTISSYPIGIDCGATCQYQFAADTIVMLTATPDEGSIFNGWSDNCVVVEQQCQIMINDAHTVTADFAIQPPQNVLLEAGDSQIRVSWDEVAGATGYTIYWGTSAGIDPTDSDTYIGSRILLNGPYYTIPLLTNDTKYFIVVTTKIGGTNESAVSVELSAAPEEYVVKYIPLNDTGIISCADEENNDLECPQEGFPNQDAQHGRDALAQADKLTKIGGGNAGFDFTKICNSGEVAGEGDCPAQPTLGSGTNDWACTRDNVTGFMWEVKTDDGGLRDKDNTYTWYNPDPNSNRGNAGTENGGECPDEGNCDTEKYVVSVNAQELCGYNDWRVPDVEELRSIVDYSSYKPAIDIAHFPNIVSSYYWSASPYAPYDDRAWRVDFYYGYDRHINNKNFNFYVRLVRPDSN